ncbi:MnmC family methyltransferase [Hydrogenivirga sp. 128-5-R1-1]|uniref:tRNA (5-methylaminomethyl-2-thiouridine)(34)-methyltransferase MnmD n=1 Tax=Hydrogenivirga sp. 128-5-R1-1 TaxID=392423 RepID=UPI00015EF7C0|nr:MnmC family methyltransferase [Hydrogenivirga sp. 128-5-R1-1]EDP74956.1 hypothetical protein HG1285_13847 [Hydrogenivirga sp. 128-5-R1-1]
MQSLRERLCERASLLGVDLTDREIDNALRDLGRWLPKGLSSSDVLKTEDGSYTLMSEEYGEPYHSVTAGALTEALEKFFKPSLLVEVAAKAERVTLLDIGFGLGYNAAVAVHELRKINKRLNIEILALDKRLPDAIPSLPEPYTKTHSSLLGMLPAGEREGVSLKLLEGDFRETLRKVVGFRADAVFHDPFSPYRNPEAWSLELLSLIRPLMKEEGAWVSYTSSLPVRRSLIELGFNVGSTPPVGRRRGGTVASLKRAFRLGEEERSKLMDSPYSTPFRDPGLELEPVDILIDYRISVLLRERALSSGGRRGLSRTPS